MSAPQKPSVYISYAHDDRKWLDLILEHLKGVAHQEKFDLFFDQVIEPGKEWARELAENREKASVAILLVSQAAVASEYMQKEEWPHLLALHERRQIMLLPIAVEPFEWSSLEELQKINFFPPQGRPLSELEPDQVDRELLKFADIVAANVIRRMEVEPRESGSSAAQQAPEMKQADLKDFQAPPPNLTDAQLEKLVMPDHSDTVAGYLIRSRQIVPEESPGISSFELLLGCLIQAGESDKDTSASFLWSQLLQRHTATSKSKPTPESLFGLTDIARRTDIDGLPAAHDFDEDGWNAIQRAVSIARRTAGNAMIHSRHLVSALLAPPEPDFQISQAERLLGLFENRGELQTALCDRIRKKHPTEDAAAWLDVYAIAEEPEPGETSPTAIEDFWTASIVGYSADDRRDKDHLNIKRDVNTLCSVIMAKDWTPPLSVGLFGDWGIGKSFFMDKMKDQIKLLAKYSQKVTREEDTKYVPYMAQVDFNAWHYVDTNLWASLVTRIFEKLSEDIFGKPLASREDPYAQARQKLFEDLESTNKQIQEAKRESSILEQAKNEAQKDYDAQKEELSETRQAIEALRQMTPGDWKKLIEQDTELKADLKRVAAELQVDAAEAAFDQVQEFIGETQTAWSRTKKLWQWARESKLSRWIAVVTLALLLFLLLMPQALRNVLGEWVRGTGAYVTGAATMIGGLLAALSPHLRRVNRFLTMAETTKRFADKAVLRREGVLRADLTQKEMIFNQSKELLEQKKHEAQRIQSQIDDIEAGRYLEDFLHERVASKDYAEQLGIIAMVRKDFETLTNRLSEGIRRNHPGKEIDSELIKIDRVVLYIDDLDRCEPKRVVEVLQAVHLLLAIELFVVVVAVDSRWLLNALRWHYQEFFHSGSDELNISREEESAWTSTPYNYLEKIFQIPFTLRPMTDAGYRKLVESLFDPTKAKRLPTSEPASEPFVVERAQQPDDHADEPKGNGEGESAMTAVAGEAGGATDEEDSEEIAADDKSEDKSQPEKDESVITGKEAKQNDAEQSADKDNQDVRDAEDDESPPDLTPEGLTLSDPEKELLGMMRPLISTPRSAKRMVNIYRLMRAPLSEVEVKTFTGAADGNPEYVAVQILLGILVGYAGMAAEVFRTLQTTKKKTFWEFVEGLRPLKSKSTKSNQQVNAIRSGMNSIEAIRWIQFCDSLLNLKTHIETDGSDELKSDLAASDSIGAYKKWFGPVARYSFRTGHVVSTISRGVF